MKKQNKILISIIVAVLVITSITLGILLPRSLDIPSDSTLYIFDKNENLVFVNVSNFTELTDSTLEITIVAFLENNNVTLIDHLTVISSKGDSIDFLKTELINEKLILGENGFLVSINGVEIDFVQGFAIDIDYYSVDIVTTIYQTLGFTGWETEGSVIDFTNNTGFTKAILFHLDGFGWRFWENLSNLGVINLNLNILFNQPGLTAYPPITNVATATMLSGFWPATTGITTRQNHILSVDTIFDIASQNNFSTELIEGDTGFIDISADIESWLPDFNGSGTNDDEIFQRTLESLNSSRSDVLFTHFHGIDDDGHSFGPYSPEWMTKVDQIFNYLNELITYIDNETLVIFTADHGMHLYEIPEDNRIGTHGDCIWEDMMVPIIIARK